MGNMVPWFFFFSLSFCEGNLEASNSKIPKHKAILSLNRSYQNPTSTGRTPGRRRPGSEVLPPAEGPFPCRPARCRRSGGALPAGLACGAPPGQERRPPAPPRPAPPTNAALIGPSPVSSLPAANRAGRGAPGLVQWGRQPRDSSCD